MELRARRNKAASCFMVAVDLQYAVPVLWETCSPSQGDKQQPVCLMQPKNAKRR